MIEEFALLQMILADLVHACWKMWRPTDDDWTIVQVKQKPQIKHVWFNMFVDHFEPVPTSENVYAELGGRGVRSPIILVDSSYV